MNQCALTYSTEQQTQEEQYIFPYHHLPQFTGGRFSEVRVLDWGYEYLSYVGYVLDRLALLDPRAVVEIGCGDGRVTLEAARRFSACHIIGVDYSPRAVAMARALHPDGKYLVGDITQPEFWQQSFSAALAIEVLEHIPPADLPGFVHSIAQGLKSQGHLLVTVPSINRPLNTKHYQHFSPETLQQALTSDFEMLECHWLNRKCLWDKFIGMVLCNRLFALRSKQIGAWLYRLYQRTCLSATPTNGKRLFALARKRESGS